MTALNLVNLRSETTSDPFANYNMFALTPILISIVIVTIILMIVICYYYFSIKKLRPDESPKGFALILFIFINYMKQLVFEVLGPRFIKLTPYFLTLFTYILVSNFIGIVGFENPTASVTVTVSMGLITFIGTFVIGFKYQRLLYLKKFVIGINVKNKKGQKTYIPIMINPLEVVGAFTPLISISMRLWGNIFAGSIIMALFYALPMAFTNNNPLLPQPQDAYAWQIIMGVFAAPLNAYLDLLTGTIQALIFTLLTMVYWKLSLPDDDNSNYKFIDYSNECCVELKNISRV